MVVISRKDKKDKLQNLLLTHKLDDEGYPQRMSDISSKNLKQNASSHVQLLSPDLGFYDKTIQSNYIQQALL
jgi:hypothetical protein